MAVIETVVKDDFDPSHEVTAPKIKKSVEPPKTEQQDEVAAGSPDTSETKVEPEIDYKAELEKEKAKRAKAEYTLYKKNKEAKQAKAEAPEINPEEIRPTIEAEVAAVLEAERQKEAEDLFEEELFNLSSDENERELIRLKYDRLAKSGFTRTSIRQDLEEARFLANRPKYERVSSELAQTVVSKRTLGGNGLGAGQERPQPTPDLSKLFSAGEWDFMKKQKFTQEMIQKAANLKKQRSN